MPELPEVTTTVNGLNKTIKSLVISGVWSDFPPSLSLWRASPKKRKLFKNTLKDPVFFKKFRKNIVGQKVINVDRRAKNILIHLSDKKIILIHLKMTGHLLYGKYVFNKKENKWTPDKKERKSLHDPYNRFIHFVITFKNGNHLVMSDSRKFGKITLLPSEKIEEILNKKIGPEPLEKEFSYPFFKRQLSLKPAGKIKNILMDQKIIAGIGNIYSDEMLWLVDIHPESIPKNIPEKNLRGLYKAMRQILIKGIKFGGDSMSDYRNINGERGNFQHHHNVYQRKNERCGKNGCSGIIKRKVVGGRSSHFCDKHQILF